jgi:hypothetical protein
MTEPEPTLRQRIGNELAKFTRESRGPSANDVRDAINRDGTGGWMTAHDVRVTLLAMEDASLVFSRRGNPAAAWRWHLSHLGRGKQERGEL